jgi:hypothetical protein
LEVEVWVRAAVRQTRPKERLVRRSEAEAPAGFNRQRQWRLKTIRLVLPIFYVTVFNRLYFFGIARFGVFLRLDATA